MKLNVKAMALTGALVFGIGLFLITWWVILFEGSSTDPNLISHIYRGYSFSPLGSLIGLMWGLLDGAVGGACVAWVYNIFASQKDKE